MPHLLPETSDDSPVPSSHQDENAMKTSLQEESPHSIRQGGFVNQSGKEVTALQSMLCLPNSPCTPASSSANTPHGNAMPNPEWSGEDSAAASRINRLRYQSEERSANNSYESHGNSCDAVAGGLLSLANTATAEHRGRQHYNDGNSANNEPKQYADKENMPNRSSEVGHPSSAPPAPSPPSGPPFKNRTDNTSWNNRHDQYSSQQWTQGNDGRDEREVNNAAGHKQFPPPPSQAAQPIPQQHYKEPYANGPPPPNAGGYSVDGNGTPMVTPTPMDVSGQNKVGPQSQHPRGSSHHNHGQHQHHMQPHYNSTSNPAPTHTPPAYRYSQYPPNHGPSQYQHAPPSNSRKYGPSPSMNPSQQHHEHRQVPMNPAPHGPPSDQHRRQFYQPEFQPTDKNKEWKQIDQRSCDAPSHPMPASSMPTSSPAYNLPPKGDARDPTEDGQRMRSQHSMYESQNSDDGDGYRRGGISPSDHHQPHVQGYRRPSPHPMHPSHYPHGQPPPHHQPPNHHQPPPHHQPPNNFRGMPPNQQYQHPQEQKQYPYGPHYPPPPMHKPGGPAEPQQSRQNYCYPPPPPTPQHPQQHPPAPSQPHHPPMHPSQPNQYHPPPHYPHYHPHPPRAPYGPHMQYQSKERSQSPRQLPQQPMHAQQKYYHSEQKREIIRPGSSAENRPSSPVRSSGSTYKPVPEPTDQQDAESLPGSNKKRRLISPIVPGTPTMSSPGPHHGHQPQSYSPRSGPPPPKHFGGGMEQYHYHHPRQPPFQGPGPSPSQLPQPPMPQSQHPSNRHCINTMPPPPRTTSMCSSPPSPRGRPCAEEYCNHPVTHENSRYCQWHYGRQNGNEHHSPNTVLSSNNTSPPQPMRSNCEINSVAQWQQAQMMTGFAPSANKCVPLKSPIPSKFWGDVEKTKEAFVPDFHRLVNFPDYLPKNRPPPGDGMRCCVMCGKQRLCTASTSKNNPKNKPTEKIGSSPIHQSYSNPSSPSTPTNNLGVSSNPTHIIPRQNKGLCTACDVTVWVVTQTGLEIKWCKGCKNFRPWAAFGDKGLATKCVRCRDRQREKYALQKENLKQKRQLFSSDDGSNSPKDLDEEKESSPSQQADKENHENRMKEDQDSDREMAAAKGLSHLLAATSQVNG